MLRGTSPMLLSVNYYDKEVRVREAFKQHYQGGSSDAGKYDDVLNSYSFLGELGKSERVHHNGSASK